MRRYPVARKRIDQRAAMPFIVQQDDGRRAAGLAVGAEQHAQSAHERIRRRQRVSCSPCRTDGGALAAAGADQRVDRHIVASRRDRASGTQTETAVDADEEDLGRLPAEGGSAIPRKKARAVDGAKVMALVDDYALARIDKWCANLEPARVHFAAECDRLLREIGEVVSPSA